MDVDSLYNVRKGAPLKYTKASRKKFPPEALLLAKCDKNLSKNYDGPEIITRMLLIFGQVLSED
jgi:hypothetical protein